MKYYTYILICSDRSYYIGSTHSLANRLKLHNIGKGANFTSKRIPCYIIWSKQFTNQKDAVNFELKIKKYSRIKKESLIFSKLSLWKHFKGNIYIILDKLDDLIIYADYKLWKDYIKNKYISGNELQCWARSSNQWFDIKNKTLRFNHMAL